MGSVNGIMKAIHKVVLITVLTTVTAERKLLQIFQGTVTEIGCSTTVPSFLINGIYTPQHYHELPGLFGIEAVIAADRSNVTIHINGTSLVENVTIECQNIIDPVLGHAETLFRCTTVFIDTLPSPTNIDVDGSMLHWAPPTQFQTLSNVSTTISINPRITHYMVYVTDLSTNSEILIRSRHRNFTFPCVYSARVSAVNSGGEGERSSTTTINNCDEGDNTDDKSGQTVQEESDYYHNQTFDVYDQEIALVGTECENTTEKLHSQDTLAIMIGTVAVTGSIALVSLGLNCVLLTLLIKSIKKSKLENDHTGDMGKYEQKVVMEQNEAYACATSLNPTYDTICAS